MKYKSLFITLLLNYSLKFFLTKEFKLFQEKIRNLLSVDGETLYPFIKCSHLLLLAKSVLIDLNQSLQDIPVN